MAIALDVATNGGFIDPGTSFSWTHVASGSNLILIVHVIAQSTSDVVSGVTYNTVAMTRAIMTAAQGGQILYTYYLINPATGSHTVLVSLGSTVTAGGLSVTYTGAKQSGQPDSSNSGTTPSASSLTVSTTTVADFSWLVGCFQAPGGLGSGYAAGTNTTQRVANSGFPRFVAHDSNIGETPPGSFSQQYTWSGTDNGIMAVISISPVTGGGGLAARKTLLKVGI